ncbi:MarR family winged helix-turn-helix transcriptional regulator [Falsiroseomonas oryziterrae]|uniref:MarR family winged helix-turn-helix transcriptional regulator n=1 Tax=Falsiroseomonas oryziterrae TaxID=2911368 RepID=UPI001EFFB231|nr:MarR family transcriptional regulator [Roseomonas sp. NPKOSM-4]
MPFDARQVPACRRPRSPGPAPRVREPAEASVATPRDALDDRLGFWLRLAQMAAFESFSQAMAPLGLTPGRLGALLLIEADPTMRQGTLAEALRVKPPNMAVLLAGLEADGLIRRVEDRSNRRANLLRLTPAGRALLRRARPREAALEADLSAGLDAGERARLLAALRRIAEGR